MSYILGPVTAIVAWRVQYVVAAGVTRQTWSGRPVGLLGLSLSEDGVGTLLSVNRLKEVVFHQFGSSIRQHEVGSG